MIGYASCKEAHSFSTEYIVTAHYVFPDVRMMEAVPSGSKWPDKKDKHANKGKVEWNEPHFDLVSGIEECRFNFDCGVRLWVSMTTVAFVDEQAIPENDAIVGSFEERVEIVNETHWQMWLDWELSQIIGSLEWLRVLWEPDGTFRWDNQGKVNNGLFAEVWAGLRESNKGKWNSL